MGVPDTIRRPSLARLLKPAPQVHEFQYDATLQMSVDASGKPIAPVVGEGGTFAERDPDQPGTATQAGRDTDVDLSSVTALTDTRTKAGRDADDPAEPIILTEAGRDPDAKIVWFETPRKRPLNTQAGRDSETITKADADTDCRQPSVAVRCRAIPLDSQAGRDTETETRADLDPQWTQTDAWAVASSNHTGAGRETAPRAADNGMAATSEQGDGSDVCTVIGGQASDDAVTGVVAF